MKRVKVKLCEGESTRRLAGSLALPDDASIADAKAAVRAAGDLPQSAELRIGLSRSATLEASDDDRLFALIRAGDLLWVVVQPSSAASPRAATATQEHAPAEIPAAVPTYRGPHAEPSTARRGSTAASRGSALQALFALFEQEGFRHAAGGAGGDATEALLDQGVVNTELDHPIASGRAHTHLSALAMGPNVVVHVAVHEGPPPARRAAVRFHHTFPRHPGSPQSRRRPPSPPAAPARSAADLDVELREQVVELREQVVMRVVNALCAVVGLPPQWGLLTLPRDAVLRALRHLDYRDLLAVRTTCRHMRDAADAPQLWLALMEKHDFTPGSANEENPREAFAFRMRLKRRAAAAGHPQVDIMNGPVEMYNGLWAMQTHSGQRRPPGFGAVLPAGFSGRPRRPRHWIL